MIRRVVITGMGGVTAFGENWQDVSVHLLAYENAVREMSEWQVYDSPRTLLGVSINDFTLPEYYIHKCIRAAGRVSQTSTYASELALEQAGLIGDPILAGGETGITHGSSTGSTGSVGEPATMLMGKHMNNTTDITYVQMMSHTTVVNTGPFFGLRGRVTSTSSAYTSGSQAIGYAWEAIRHGYQTVVVAGGAEKLCLSEATISDTLFATNQHNDAPKIASSPFGENRGRLAIGEGAGTLILEELEYAKACGTTIYGEIAGFATNCDAAHVTQSQRETMQRCMGQSLKIAGLNAQDTGYISTHGTATDHGDIAKSLAIATIYGDNVPISSLKSYFGRILGACGASEAWMSLQVAREGWSAPVLNLNKPGPNCGTLDYIMHGARKVDCGFLQSNNLAFGGINTSIIVKRWP